MLLNIDPLLHGDILRTLDHLGHNDRLLVADANFPWAKYAVPTHRIGTSTLPAMRALLEVFPLEDADGDAVIVRTENDGDELDALQREVLRMARERHGPALEFSRPTRREYREILRSATSAIILLTDLTPSNYLLRKGMITA